MSSDAATIAAIAEEIHSGKAEAKKDYIRETAGLWSWLSTLDHKRIGMMYLMVTSVAFLAGGTFAMLVRIELLSPGRTIMSADAYNQVFTLHGVIMVFLFIIPTIPAALGNFLIPIMLGAKDVAFPRLNLFSFYIYIVGASMGLTSMIVGSVDTGWTFYTPYSSSTDFGTHNAVIWMTGSAFTMGFSSILTGVNFIATVHKMRAPGQTWRRLPLFVWAAYATSVIQVLATPVLAITLLLLIMERGLGLGIFDPHLGGDPVLFQHFFWFYSHPAVYIMILPGMGIASELISAFSRRELFGYMFVAMSSVGLALVGFIVWGHHMFTSGQSEYSTMVFSGLTFLVAIPSGVKVFNWVGTLYGGHIELTSPMLYGLGFIFMFTIGGLTGLFCATLSVDIHLHDTYFIVAHFHYVMVGGTVCAFFGGMHYWWPKFTGKMASETLGKLSFWLFFWGFNQTFLTQFIMGSRGMPRRYYDYLPEFTDLHRISSIGAFIIGLSVLVMLINFGRSFFAGPPAPPNPWGVSGFEWQTPSPPPLENFIRTPIITRGPYDFHACTPAELDRGFPKKAESAAKAGHEKAGSAAKADEDKA